MESTAKTTVKHDHDEEKKDVGQEFEPEHFAKPPHDGPVNMPKHLNANEFKSPNAGSSGSGVSLV